MIEKSTDDLSEELMNQPNLELYIHDNQSQFTDQGVAELLTALYQQHTITKAALARQAGMSEVYLHQVFSGRRNPSRDRLLCLCIGLEATLEEVQQLLKRAGYAPIYPKLQRESIICHGILHHTPLSTINDNLFAANEKTLF